LRAKDDLASSHAYLFVRSAQFQYKWADWNAEGGCWWVDVDVDGKKLRLKLLLVVVIGVLPGI
jgi:hypothetical protein